MKDSNHSHGVAEPESLWAAGCLHPAEVNDRDGSRGEVTLPTAGHGSAEATTAAPFRTFRIRRWRCDGEIRRDEDAVAVEEPLLIRVCGRNVAVVMRTPGHDRELAAGFLFTEGVIRHRDDLLDLLACRELDGAAEGNVVEAVLAPGVEVDFDRLTRHVFSGSSCGVCGKTTLDAVFMATRPVRTAATFDPETLSELPQRLAAVQPAFGATGGLHASALFSAAGEFVAVREDVGRHNALDKVIGRALLDDRLPLSDHGLLVSGRVSFELVQKSVAAGIPLIAGIGAPSSLAIECAQRARQTLVGFVRADRMNVYTTPEL